MVLNVTLNEDLGIRIWSFPMRYLPTDRPDRTYVGEHWSRYELRSMQLILQATHGVVSGAPTFFRRAFGASAEDFQALLLRQHHALFCHTCAVFDQGPVIPRNHGLRPLIPVLLIPNLFARCVR